MGDDPTSEPQHAGLHTVARTDECGPASAATPVVLVHGFGQDHRCLGPLADALAARGPVVTVDAPGHGGSRHLADADLPTTAGLLADVLARAGAGGPVDLVGYSMGGRMALQTALDRPGAVRRLVLVGATPGIEDTAARAARAEQDRATAARLTDGGIDAFVDEWLDGPLFSGLPPEHRFVDERRSQDAAALAANLRVAGTGAMVPLWDRLPTLTVPVLCLAGSLDVKFAEVARRMGTLLPSATVVVVEGAGHAAHLEQPDAVVRAVVAHLDA